MNDDIKVFGLFGFPLSHSLSPSMHNEALKALGIPGIYFAFERNKKQFLRLVRSKKKIILDGFNLTVPLKECVLPYLDSLDDSAKQAGAVNTVHRTGNHFRGYNTDLFGILQSFRKARFSPRGKKAVILGAGGAARGVAAALAKGGAREIGMINRTISKSIQVVREFQRKFPRVRIKAIRSEKDLKSELRDIDLLVNATSVGLKEKDRSLVSSALFPKKKILVFDLIYGRKTELLKTAKKLGHKTISGETMLLYQGARAFEIWTKRKAPISVMRKALHDGIMAR